MGCGYSLLSAFSGMSFFFSGMSFIGSNIVAAELIIVIVWLFSLVVAVSIRLSSSCVVAVPGIVSRFAAAEAEVFLLSLFLLLAGNAACETSI